MRPNPLLPLWLASACGLLLLCAPSAKAQCGVNSIGFGNVGLAAGNPFQAEIVITRPFKTELNGIIAQRGPGMVARDSQGRVRIESVGGEFEHDNGPEAGTKAAQHMIMICDPVAQTLTQIDTLNATATIIHSRPSAPNWLRLQPSGPARTFCSSRMPLIHNGHMRVEDLGYQTIARVEAHGERISMPIFGAPARGESIHSDNTMDRWCSDELAAVVLTVTGNAKTGTKSSVAMQNIERNDPDPALFQIPADYAVTESVADPHERQNRNAAPPPPSDQP